jgi:hypothetical protein
MSSSDWILLAVAAIGMNPSRLSRLWTRQVREQTQLLFEPSSVGNPVLAGLVLSEFSRKFRDRKRAIKMDGAARHPSTLTSPKHADCQKKQPSLAFGDKVRAGVFLRGKNHDCLNFEECFVWAARMKA